jgi:hypothetical protein
MPVRPSRSSYDPWRDAHGAPIPQRCRIEQVAVGKGHGALPSRLRKQGLVLGRGVIRLRVLFDGEDTVVGIRPHLVRVITVPSSPTGSELAGSDCRG